jgi:catechol 2,3-dioxygenase-like lactoylglutathione lyase family enzyme
MDVQAIVMYVDDVDRSGRFFGDRLGLPLVYENHGRCVPDRREPAAAASTRDRGVPRSGEDRARGRQISFGVDDVDGLVERLNRDGVPVVQQQQDEPWGERDAVVRDPDGLRVRLSQSLPDTWPASR